MEVQIEIRPSGCYDELESDHDILHVVIRDPAGAIIKSYDPGWSVRKAMQMANEYASLREWSVRHV